MLCVLLGLCIFLILLKRFIKYVSKLAMYLFEKL